MNPFLHYPFELEQLPPTPKRLYARIDDVVELEGSDFSRWRIGCVDADWFDDNRESVVATHLAERKAGLERIKVVFLEVEVKTSPGFPQFSWAGRLFDWEEWLVIVLEPGTN